MDNKKLREDRLVFYQDLVREVNRLLREFLKLSNAKCAMIVDREGHMVTRQGVTRDLDVDTIAALVAGSFAATREMARLLGEDEFSVLFHQGRTDSIQLSLVGDRTLLVAIFDQATTIGMVRLYAAETTKALAALYDQHARDLESGSATRESLESNFADSAKGKLDDLFG